MLRRDLKLKLKHIEDNKLKLVMDRLKLIWHRTCTRQRLA